MRRRGIPPAHNSHPNVTPLIDIVMCLIIFFMLIAKIGVSTGAEKMTIPATIRGTDIKDFGSTLTLNVRSGVGGEDGPEITALVGHVKEELKTGSAAGGKSLVDTLKYFRFGEDMRPGGTGRFGDNPNFEVIIRGEEDLQYRYLQPILEAAAEAQVKKVSFNTRKVTVMVK